MKKTPVRLGSCRCVCSLHCLLWIGGLVYYWPPKISGRHTFNELRAGFTPGPLTFLLPARGLFCYPGPHTINELGGCFGARPSKIYAAFMPSLSHYCGLGDDSGTTAYRLGTLPGKLAYSLASTGWGAGLLLAARNIQPVNTIDGIGDGSATRPLRFLRALIPSTSWGAVLLLGPSLSSTSWGPHLVLDRGTTRNL
jgi:hypothetical protein